MYCVINLFSIDRPKFYRFIIQNELREIIAKNKYCDIPFINENK